jgi:predicted metal-dependent hydrolase
MPKIPQLPLWSEASVPIEPTLRYSQRARRVAVRISAGGKVELVVPRGVSERHARAFLESRKEWVRQHLARRQLRPQSIEAFPPERIELPMLGESWRVFQAGGLGRLRLRQAEGFLELRGAGTREQMQALLRRWLVAHAQPALALELAVLARQHGFEFQACQVRSQRSRWGSCSARRNISLNVALLFQPLDVVRYLLCHELAHTRHMNHSQQFWQCVASCEPRFREMDAALSKEGWRRVPQWVRGQDDQ